MMKRTALTLAKRGDDTSVQGPPILGLSLLWFLACALALIGLGDLPLKDFDEATVARVAFELSRKSGFDQLLPTLWGADYINKPPGLHWLIAAVIKISRNGADQFEQLPSEFLLRLVPAILSTCIVPLGGLIQWKLKPNEPIASLATSAILLTLLPLARHGRLAMLDGTQLSVMALLWYFFASMGQSQLDRLRAFGAGLASTYLLLLKAPFVIPALLAGGIPMILTTKFKKIELLSLGSSFVFGLIPGISWHVWHGMQRGAGALWLWGGDGAGRVLFSVGEGSDLGFLVPVIEILEGGWPWLLFWPIGIFWAWEQRGTRWGLWAFGTQLILALSILPLRTQLPWYSHPLWLPFAIVCGPILAWLINRKEVKDLPAKYFLGRTPYFLSFIGAVLLILACLSFFDWLEGLAPYQGILYVAGTGWCIGGWYLTRSSVNRRISGALLISLGSFLALTLLMRTSFWLWELNESWPVSSPAEMINRAQAAEIFIEGTQGRPSLNWYSKQQIKPMQYFDKSGWILVQQEKLFMTSHSNLDCHLDSKSNEWNLLYCRAK